MKPSIFTGSWGKCHIQGIAVDEEKDGIMTSVYLKEVVDDYNGDRAERMRGRAVLYFGKPCVRVGTVRTHLSVCVG